MPTYEGLKQAVIIFNDLDKVGVEMQKIPEGSAEKWHVGLTYLDAGSGTFKLGAFMKNKAEADQVIADVEAANP